MSDHRRNRIDLGRMGEQTTRLTVAVRVVDSFTGKVPSTDLTVTVGEFDVLPVRNPSGYYCFLDLPDNPITVTVNGGERYLDVTETVDPAAHDPPAVDIEVTPSPAYRFPPGATLIRGIIREGGSDENSDDNGEKPPIAGATVSLRHIDREAVTNENGEFVLFITNITDEDVVQTDDGRRVITVSGSDPVIEADHPDYGTVSESITVEERLKTRHDLFL